MHKEPGDEVGDTTKYHNDLEARNKKCCNDFQTVLVTLGKTIRMRNSPGCSFLPQYFYLL